MYLFNEGKLNVDTEQWQDKSIMLLSNESGQSISIARDFIPWGMTFVEFAEREITSIGKQLKHYKELTRQNITINGFDSVLTEFQWDSPQGHIHQITCIINYPNVVLMLTASSDSVMSDGQRQHLLDILTSFEGY